MKTNLYWMDNKVRIKVLVAAMSAAKAASPACLRRAYFVGGYVVNDATAEYAVEKELLAFDGHNLVLTDNGLRYLREYHE